MTKYVHIVYVHPVELGEPNLHKVKYEQEFTTKEAAENWIYLYNFLYLETELRQAVYLGRVNDETGEME